MEYIDYKNTDEVVCPYCGYEFGDSWEFQMNGCEKITCDECNKEFECEAETTIAYSSCKLPCVGEHSMKFTLAYIKDTTYKNGKDEKLPVGEFEYTEAYDCENCEEAEWKKINKEEFRRLYPEKFETYANHHPEMRDDALEVQDE